MLSMPSRSLWPKRSRRSSRTRAPPPRINPCSTTARSNPQPLQEAHLGTPLLGLRAAPQPRANYIMHMQILSRNEFKRIQRAEVCSETNSSMQINLHRAAREWHASRALGEGAYPHHAGQSLHARGAEGAAAPPAPTRSRRKRPQASQRSQAAASSPQRSSSGNSASGTATPTSHVGVSISLG